MQGDVSFPTALPRRAAANGDCSGMDGRAGFRLWRGQFDDVAYSWVGRFDE